MTESDIPQEHTLEERVARLEGALGWGSRTYEYLDGKRFILSVLFVLVGIGVGLGGLGQPNHIYQFVFATISVGVAYNRAWLLWPRQTYQWILAGLNCWLLAILYKLVIGSGTAQPLQWLRLPVLGNDASTQAADKSSSWAPKIPSIDLRWEEIGLTATEIDLTLMQTFLLLITIIGCAFEFQPFASLTALLLIVASLPAFLSFEWQWVFPTILMGALGLYLQARDGA